MEERETRTESLRRENMRLVLGRGGEHANKTKQWGCVLGALTEVVDPDDFIVLLPKNLSRDFCKIFMNGPPASPKEPLIHLLAFQLPESCQLLSFARLQIKTNSEILSRFIKFSVLRTF